MYKLIPIALLAILVVGCKGGDTTAATTGGGSSTPSAAKEFTFKLQPKQGEKFAYDIKVDAGPSKMEMGSTMTVEKVENDKYTLVMTIDSVKMDGKDAPAAVADAMKKAKTTMVMDSTGKTLSVTSEAGGQSSSVGGVAFPTKAIKIGDTWDATNMANGTEVKTTYKLVSIENAGGKELAVIEATPASMPGVTLDGPMVMKIDTANGMTHSMDMKMKMKGPDGKDMVSTMSMQQK